MINFENNPLFIELEEYGNETKLAIRYSFSQIFLNF